MYCLRILEDFPLDLLLHIGSPEAIAPYVHTSLAANEDWLRDRGMTYGDVLSKDSNHITLYFAVASEILPVMHQYGLSTKSDLAEFRSRLSAHLDAQIQTIPARIHTMVMSTPALTGMKLREREITALHSLLAPRFENVKILIYVRRQDDALLYRYSDLIRRGQTNAPFTEFVDESLSGETRMHHLDYRRALAPWLRIWGAESIVLRRFSPVDLINRDILADVLGVAMDTWTPDLDGFHPSPDGPPVLSAPALEFLRQIQPKLPSHGPKRRKLIPVINTLARAPRPIMSAATARQIMGHYRSTNTWLKDTFAPDLPGPFFPERVDHPEYGNLGHLTAPDAANFAGHILGRVQI